MTRTVKHISATAQITESSTYLVLDFFVCGIIRIL